MVENHRYNFLDLREQMPAYLLLVENYFMSRGWFSSVFVVKKWRSSKRFWQPAGRKS